jgi:hypothetical protein
MSDRNRPPWMQEINPYSPFPDTGKVTVAVVTGEHPYNVPALHNMFRSFPGIDYYLQALEDYVADFANVRTAYDVVLFCGLPLDTPPANERGWWWLGQTRNALDSLGETRQGIVLLHHALAAFPGWESWSDLAGIPHAARTYTLAQLTAPGALSVGERIHIEIADQEHPITRGLAPWDMYGETWSVWSGDRGGAAPVDTAHNLLLTDHPKMAMKQVAWTHQHGQARVFCLQPGHNNDSYADPSYRTVLSRGILWAAGRL